MSKQTAKNALLTERGTIRHPRRKIVKPYKRNRVSIWRAYLEGILHPSPFFETRYTPRTRE